MAGLSPITTRSDDRHRPPLFAEELRTAKKALDPQGLLNPGVLIDP
jgi:alkyldihydroxyacetonephosphate synthase